MVLLGECVSNSLAEFRVVTIEGLDEQHHIVDGAKNHDGCACPPEMPLRLRGIQSSLRALDFAEDIKGSVTDTDIRDAFP